MLEEDARLLRWRNEAALPLIANIRISAQYPDDTGDQVGQTRPKAPNGGTSQKCGQYY
jgi:hypothetical protein